MGGHVFGIASSIVKENINPTVEAFKNELMRIFPKVDFSSIILLGSAGKKDVSGDIDLGMSDQQIYDFSKWNISQQELNARYKKFKSLARKSSDIVLIKRAAVTCIAEKMKSSGLLYGVSTKASVNGTIFCCFPQFIADGKQTEFNVQIDLNFGNLQWLKFSYFSQQKTSQELKGLYRTQLLVALFSEKGFTFSHAYGVKNATTNRVVATTPAQAAGILKLLYNDYSIKEETLTSDFYTLWNHVKSNLREEDLENVASRYLRILDYTPGADIPECLQDF